MQAASVVLVSVMLHVAGAVAGILAVDQMVLGWQLFAIILGDCVVFGWQSGSIWLTGRSESCG
jgi:hypothetical protein